MAGLTGSGRRRHALSLPAAASRCRDRRSCPASREGGRNYPGDPRLLSAIGTRARAGLPYLGVSAGANLACPTIRTTNDMPIVQPASLSALALIPFQVNPHYPAAGPLREARDQRLGEFLEENDVPVLGLCEGSWLHVSAARATLGGTAGGRVLARGHAPRDVQPGDDLTALLSTRPRYDSPAR